MIPLREWLRHRQVHGSLPSVADFAEPALAEPQPAGLAAAIAEAYERGRAESDAAAHELVQGAIAGERERHGEELRQAREAKRHADIETLASEIGQTFAALHEFLARHTAAALEGFLEGGARTKALLAFRAALDDLAETHPLVRLEGPQELIASLTELGTLPPGIALKPSQATELRAIAGDTAVDMALQRWLQALHGDHG